MLNFHIHFWNPCFCLVSISIRRWCKYRCTHSSLHSRASLVFCLSYSSVSILFLVSIYIYICQHVHVFYFCLCVNNYSDVSEQNKTKQIDHCWSAGCCLSSSRSSGLTIFILKIMNMLRTWAKVLTTCVSVLKGDSWKEQRMERSNSCRSQTDEENEQN